MSETIEWTAQQSAARRAVAEWYQARRARPKGTSQIFRLFGFAGTGKTTLAETLNQDLTGGEAQFLAPTAKAATVLRSRGAANAETIHSQIYQPKEKSRQRLRDLEAMKTRAEADRNRALSEDKKRSAEMLKREIEKIVAQIDEEQKKVNRPSWTVNAEAVIKDRPLIVLDESSMVGQPVAEDLLSYGVPILALGDPAQLPPVGGDGFFTTGKPDVMLTDIQRQALDNPIIRLATTVREGGNLRPGRYGESLVIPRSELNAAMVTDADQLLVGRNATRRSSNMRIRQLKDYDTAFPVKGERVVCLRNDRDIGIANGCSYVLTEDAADMDSHVTLWLQEEGAGTAQYVADAHRGHFLNEDIPWYEKKDWQEFDFGYALTVHKSQGSQWGRVTLFDEWFNRDSRQQWLYTGLTRAAEAVTVVQF